MSCQDSMTKQEAKLDVARQIFDNLRLEPEAKVLEWRNRWWSCEHFTEFGEKLRHQLKAHAATGGRAVGLVARNRPAHVAALAALIAERQPVSMVYAFQSPAALAADLAQLRPGIVLLDESDWSSGVEAALSGNSCIALLLGNVPEDGFRVIVPPPSVKNASQFHQLPGPGIEILSSGTTGPPKRIFHGVDMLFRSLESGFQSPSKERRPDLVFWPLGGIGGILQLASALIQGRPFVLLEKFSVNDIVSAITRYKMTSVPFTPTMLRMIYDADVPPAELASLDAFFGGSGPLDPDLQLKVEARYGKPVIWALGATEFCGTVIGWTLELHRQYGSAKRGSAGRPLPGCHVRIVNPDSGETQPVGTVGRMEILVERMGTDWIITNDLALVDEDGFVFHRGRSDGAIVRGGFKVIPENVCETLRLHPDIAEVAVVGVPDERLGEVPVAVVELRHGIADVSSADLAAFLRDRIASPQIPTRFIFVKALPYTASTKVNIAAVREIVASSSGAK
jgi:long-chain acyl-CoA synthetase